MDQVERLGVERDRDPGDESGAADGPESANRYRSLAGDERRTREPGVGGDAAEGQVDPVDGGPREDQVGD